MRIESELLSNRPVEFEGEINAEQIEAFFNSDRYGGRHIDLDAEAIEDARSYPDEDIDELRLRASMRQARPRRDLRIPAAIVSFLGATMITLSVGGILRATVTFPEASTEVLVSSAFDLSPAHAATPPQQPPLPAETAPGSAETPQNDLRLNDIALPRRTEPTVFARELAEKADADPVSVAQGWREIAAELPGRSLLISHEDAPHAVLLFANPDGMTAAPANLPAMPDARPVLWQVGDQGVTRFIADLGAGPVTVPGMALEPGKRFLVTLEPDGPVSALPEGPIVMQSVMLEAS